MKRKRSTAGRRSEPGLVGTLSTCEVVGIWEWDPATGRFLFDEGAARVIAGDARLAGQVLQGERATAGLDLSDAARLLDGIRRAAETEDDVRVPIRVTAPPHAGRFLLCRGGIQRGEPNRPIRVEGTLVETAALAPEASAWLRPDEGRSDAIDEAAELLIAARRAIDISGSRRLRQLVDVLLLEVAREIASRSEGERQRQH